MITLILIYNCYGYWVLNTNQVNMKEIKIILIKLVGKCVE